MMGDLVRHAAEQEALCAGHALVAHDDEAGLLLLGDVEDGVRGVSLAGVGLDIDAALRDLLSGALEDGGDLLTRIHRPVHVLRDLLALVPQATLRDGLVGADQVDLGRHALRELAGLADRLPGGVGAIGAYDYRAEQRPSSLAAIEGRSISRWPKKTGFQAFGWLG